MPYHNQLTTLQSLYFNDPQHIDPLLFNLYRSFPPDRRRARDYDDSDSDNPNETVKLPLEVAEQECLQYRICVYFSFFLKLYVFLG